MLADVKKSATQLLTHHSENVELLIKRWLGKNEQYGRV
jgi:hypothetical protein